jgi:hypothetical protein
VPDPTTLLVIVAAVTIGLPVVFLIAVAYAAGRRRRGIPIGGRLSGFLTILGGMTIGVFLLTGADDLLVALPILGAAVLLSVSQWRRRRRVQAGQIIFGTALPWTILWTIYLVGTVMNPGQYDTQAVVTWFSIGLAGVIAGAVVIARGDPPAPQPTPEAGAGEPGSRAFGNIAAAIREPGRVGPFGTSELAALVAFVTAWILVPLLAGSFGLPSAVGFVASIVAGAVFATEAYIRAMPARSRRAFEAFSWLGEWELQQAAATTSGSVPTSPAAAGDWLASHPETPENRWLRVDVLLLAKRFDEAKVAAEQMPDVTPEDRWARAQALDSVDWRAGGEGDIAGMRAAAAELQPADGEDRLRAEVSIATSEVLRRMADGRSAPGDALEPLLEVRKRLGPRADGQVGRALRRRLLTTTLIVSSVFGGLFWLLNPIAGRLL